jgi:DNA mismatch endonuclease (patch repair protein)
VDVFTKAKRSQVMSRIRGYGNKDTELALIRVFRAHRMTGWRRHQQVFGKPDFVFPKLRLAVFVDGCFWHGCPKHGKKPSTNSQFWEEKLETNKKRDRRVNRVLRNDGWRVIRVWEHELASSKQPRLAARIKNTIKKIHARKTTCTQPAAAASVFQQ